MKSLRRVLSLAAIFALTSLSFRQPCHAAQRDFVLAGVTITLSDVSNEADVFFQSMRLNRSLNVWNVDVTVLNKSGQPFEGPVVVLVDSFTGTTGAQSPDGRDDNQPAKAFFDFTGTLTNGKLLPGERSTKRTLTLGVQAGGSPKLTVKVFARAAQAIAGLNIVRTLNAFGQPLPSVLVEDVSAGTELTGALRTDEAFGLATLTQTNAVAALRFFEDGYLPVWRIVGATSNGVGIIPSPRLTRRDTNITTFTPIAGGALTRGTPPIEVKFKPGSFAANTVAQLTPLTPQTLPLLLPQGWSPLGAFWLELAREPVLPGSAGVTPLGPIATTESAAWVKLNTNSLTWEVLQRVNGNGGNAVNVALPGSGAYALVVPDAAPIAPPVPAIGNVLPPSTAPQPDATNLVAIGTVTPSVSPASKVPELVTATGEIIVTNLAGNLPSGTLLRGEVTETYNLRDGSRRVSPQYENFIIGYQRPGDANLTTLRATFPLRPLLLFGAEELNDATVKMNVLAPTAFGGAVLDSTGGQLASGNLRILAGVGDLLNTQAAQLRLLEPTNFAALVSANMTLVAAFDLAIGSIASDHKLVVQWSGSPTNSVLVLAKVLSDRGVYGLQPVERLASDAAGKLSSTEPANGERLPGITGAGQYVLLRVNAPQAIISGVAQDARGQPAGGLVVRVDPWLAISAAPTGAFKLLAPIGAAQLSVSDLATGDTGIVTVTVTDPQFATNATLTTAAQGPRVLSVSPANNAVVVSRVTPIIVNFSEPINPATLAAGGIQLLGSNGAPVTASVTLNLKNTTATLLPTAQLAPNAPHTVRLSPNISDFTGAKLEGANTFTFTTENNALLRLGAQLEIYEPVNNSAGMVGGAGLAEPGGAVILINETTGETATVLARPDGSFSNSIPANVDDLLSALIVNRNGTRNVVPASRQIFRDGSVGLFNGGGTIEAATENGPMQLRVDPGAIAGRTIYKLGPVTRAQVLQLLQGSMPTNGEVMLGGFTVSQTGEDPSSTPHLSFPINPAQLGLPPGARPEEASFALTVPLETDDGQLVYEIVDQMHYEDGKLVTRSFIGPALKQLLSSLKSSKKLSLSTVILHSLGLPSLQETILHQLFLPIMMAQGTTLGITGRTISQAVTAQGQPIAGTVRVEPGTVVTGARGRSTNAPPGQVTEPIRGQKLRTGDLFTLSDQKGVYLLLFPVDRLAGGEAFVLTGTHPAFPFTLATESVGLGTISQFQFTLSADLTFPRVPLDTTSGPDVTPPKLVVAVEPRDPLPGTNSNQGATVTVAGLDDQAMALLTLAVDQASLLSLNPGLTNPPQVSLTVIPGSQTNSPHSQQASYRLTCDRRATVQLNASATDLGGNLRDSSTLVFFAGDRALPAPSNSDTVGPRVIATWPPDGATGVTPGTPVTVLFSEQLDHNSLTNFAQWLVIGGSGKVSSVKAAADNKSATIFFSGASGQPVTFTINNQLTDRAGNPFDQQPGQSGSQSHTWNVNLIVPTTANLTAGTSGGGVASKGRYLFALDRQPGFGNNVGVGAVFVYDLISSPPSVVTTVSLAGPARDLALIPNYTYKLKDGGPSVTGDLLAVVGGQISADTPFQFLRVFDVTDPASPVRIATASISLAIATVGKVQWAPPLLLYLESGADVTSIGIINLQSFLIGINATAQEAAAFPAAGREGVDLNDDGDFGDPGETVPLPQRNPAVFFGKEFSVVASTDTISTTQRILDFDHDPESGLFGMTLSAGFVRAPDGTVTATALPPAYRTIATRTGFLDPVLATLPFTADPTARPKRVAIFGSVRLDGETNSIVRNIAVVSLADVSPTKLAVIDITEPLAPVLMKTVPLTGLSIPQTLTRRADGLLALATSDDVILIDPAKLLLDAPPGGQLPFIVGVIAGTGSGANSFATETGGINAVNLGAKRSLTFSAPQFQFITFPNQAPNTAINLASLDDDAKRALLAAAEVRAVLSRTKFFTNVAGTSTQMLTTPNPNTHYYVRVDALGSLGGIGGTLPLVVESLNNAGQALPAPGPSALPVRLASSATLTALGDTNTSFPVPHSLTAVRLSSSPGSPLYNVYLAGPITLAGGALSLSSVTSIENQLQRAILKAGRLLWVGLDQTATAIPYPTAIRSTVASSRLIPGASGFAQVDSAPLPVILIPGVAGSHLNATTPLFNVAEFELWPGFTDVGKGLLSLKPGDITPPIVVSDVLRRAPEPYGLLGSLTPDPLICNAPEIYLPLIEYLVNEVGLTEYDYLKANGPLSCANGGNPATSAQSRKKMAEARTLAGWDDSQLDRNPNLFVFPYDWRKANTNATALLKEYMQVVKLFHPEAEQVNIVAHSMGGLVARRFILDNPGVVNKLITLGAPWLGAPKAINALETGDFLDFIQHLLVIKKSTLKELAEFFPGPQELVPSQAYFDVAGPPFLDRAGDFPGSLPGLGGGALTFPQFKQVMDDIYHTNVLVTPAAVTEAFHDYDKPGVGKQDDWRVDNTGVEYYHIVGVQSDANTIGRVIARLQIVPAEDSLPNLFELKREFTVEYTLGDGTVPVASSTRIGNGLDLNAPGAHLYRLISTNASDDKLTDHNGMLANSKLKELVGRILGDDIPAPDAPAVASSNVTHVVRFVDAQDNEVTAFTPGNPSLNSAPKIVGSLSSSLLSSLLPEFLKFGNEENIPGLEIEEPATNVVEAVFNGSFEVDAQYDGRPMNLRVDRLVNGVVEKSFLWHGLNPSDFVQTGPSPAGLAGRATAIGLLATASPSAPPATFKAELTEPADIFSEPTLILDSGATQITRPPTAVLDGPAARDATPPVLSFYYTNTCRDIAFVLTDNFTTDLTAVFAAGPPANPSVTAKLRPFLSPGSVPTNVLLVAVNDLLAIAVSNRVDCYAEDAAFNPSTSLSIDLLAMELALDAAGTEKLTDWPAANGRLRSAKKMLNTSDRVFITLRAKAGQGDNAFRVKVQSESDTVGLSIKLEETATGVYKNSLPQDVLRFVPFDPSASTVTGVEIKDEEIVTFELLNAAGVTLSMCNVMVDIGELALATLTHADRPDIAKPRLDFIEQFFNASDGFHFANAGTRTNFPDNVGHLTGPGPANEMGRFIINFADPSLPNVGEADVLYVHCHGSRTGALLDHQTAAGTPGPGVPIVVPETHILGSGTWRHDADLLILDACTTLNPGLNDDLSPSGRPAGRTNWLNTIRSSPRPVHGILGFEFPKSSAIRPAYVDFMSEMKLGETIPNSWSNAMTDAGMPWAFLWFQANQADTIRDWTQDPAPTETVAYVEYIGPWSANCEDQETPAGPLLGDFIPAGKKILMDRSLLSARAPTGLFPQAIHVQPQRLPRASVALAGPNRNRFTRDSYFPRGTNAALVFAATNDTTAAAAAADFLARTLALPSSSVRLVGVGEVRSCLLTNDLPAPKPAHEAFVVLHRQLLGGLPVEGSVLRVELTGMNVRGVSTRGFVAPATELLPGNSPVLSPWEALGAQLPELEATVLEGEARVAISAELVWVRQVGLTTAVSPASEPPVSIVPAWRFDFRNAANSESAGSTFIHALDGKPVQVAP